LGHRELVRSKSQEARAKKQDARAEKQETRGKKQETRSESQVLRYQIFETRNNTNCALKSRNDKLPGLKV
jgi:hypothetical protein